MDATLPTNRLGDSLLVTLPLGIDASALRSEAPLIFEKVANSDLRRVVFDCSSVEIMDGRDLEELARLGTVLRMMGRRTLVCGVHPSVAFTAATLEIELGSLEFVGTLDEIHAHESNNLPD